MNKVILNTVVAWGAGWLFGCRFEACALFAVLLSIADVIDRIDQLKKRLGPEIKKDVKP